MRPVERIDESTAVSNFRPAVGLHRAGEFEGEFVELLFASAGVGNTALVEQAQEVAVGGNVVESVIVYSDVGNVRGHPLKRPVAAQLEKRFVARGVVLQQRRTVDEALRPFGPTARGVFAVPGKDGRGLAGFVILVDGKDLRSRRFPEPGDFLREVGGLEVGANF